MNPADPPIMTLSLSLNRHADDPWKIWWKLRVAQKISQISGVGWSLLSGGQRPAARKLNAQAIAASV